MTVINVAYAPEGINTIQRTGAPIWENLYGARVAYVDTLSVERIKNSGLYSTGNRQLDRQMHQDQVNVMISIDAMVEYFRSGVVIHFTRPADTRDIYDIVNNYLLAWKAQVENGLNLSDVPVDDLMVLDRFAEKIYPLALKFGAVRKNLGSSFANFFQQGNGQFLTRESVFGGKDEQEKLPEQHASHAPNLAKSLARMREHWI